MFGISVYPSTDVIQRDLGLLDPGQKWELTQWGTADVVQYQVGNS